MNREGARTVGAAARKARLDAGLRQADLAKPAVTHEKTQPGEAIGKIVHAEVRAALEPYLAMLERFASLYPVAHERAPVTRKLRWWEKTIPQMGPRETLEEQWEARWQEMFRRLESFKKRHGHCQVPFNYPADPALARWIRLQRWKAREKFPLERYRQLQALGFVFNPLAEIWEQRYRELCAFRKQHGHCEVPFSNENYSDLGRWVAAQRTMNSQGHLEPSRKKRLDQLGFSWAEVREKRRDARIEKYLSVLAALKERFGHCNVPAGLVGDRQFASWLGYARRCMRTGKGPAGFKERLLELGLKERVGLQPDLKWDQRFEELKGFMAQQGRSRLSRELRTWIYNQRVDFRRGAMRPDRKARLDQLGFKFELNPKPTPQARKQRWEKGFAQLKEYHRRHGHVNGPFKDQYSKLSLWTKFQRRDKRQGTLDAEHERRLEALGFPWKWSRPIGQTRARRAPFAERSELSPDQLSGANR